jgi:hypothetical protein
MNRSTFKDVQPHIFYSFRDFHEENPKIFRLFRKFAYQLKRAGKAQYGAKAIMERIRWHLAVETNDEDFKINNNYTSCYARLLVANNQRFKGFFELRSTQ